MKFPDYLFRNKPAAWAAILILLPLIAWLDYATGTEISISIFYLVPVSLAAWTLGKPQGIAVSFLGALTWLWMDKTGGHAYSSANIQYWNSLVRLLFFLITGVTLSRLKAVLQLERKMSSLKSEMVSLVSHEFNNALVSINLVSVLLQESEDGAVSDQRRKFYQVLDQTHRKLTQTVKTFLTKARLESGRFKLELRRLELRGLVKETLAVMAPLAEEKGISVITDFPPEVVPLLGDPDVIGLVAANLIGNAIKYTPRGGNITTRIRAPEANGETAEFSVIDTGIGISPEETEAIFSGFHRTTEGKRAAAGYGIGLKVSRELLDAHGSRLWVESVQGKGSRFYFTLPVYRNEP